MPPTSIKALVKDYCSNCSFAGVHYIADDTKHWLERWLWLGLVMLSWYGSGLLIIAAWDAFVSSPISFGVETTYTHWNTKMPAVAICETSNDPMLYNVSDTIWTPDHLYELEDALKDIVYFRGQTFALVDLCYKSRNPDPQCPMSNYSSLAYLVRSDCPNMITNCAYNGKSFNCCEYFQLIDTDMGRCFIINSIQTKNSKPYPMVSNLKNKAGILSFDTLLKSTMYTLGEDEVPTVTTLQSSTMEMHLGQVYKRHLAVKNIVNDPLVHQTSPEQRACLFPDENDGGLYPYYSYSACTVLCRKRAQLDTCKCNDHFMLDTSEEEICNITGVACLDHHATQLTTLKPHWANRPGLSCHCLPSCNETDISVIKDVSKRKKGKTTSVQVILTHLPTERYKRAVVRSRLDLVVSIGSTTGLFVGASLLSFVELVFYFTVRYTNNILIERRRKIKNRRVKREVRFKKIFDTPPIISTPIPIEFENQYVTTNYDTKFIL